MDQPNLDIDGVVDSLIRNNNMTKLIEEDEKYLRQIKLLRSEMHTLLYENYNKLINAAQTIRHMSNNFDQMEIELISLSENMVEITKQYNQVSFNLSDKFQHLSKLSSQYSTLKKVQFLFEFPENMKRLVESSQPAAKKTAYELLKSFVFVHGQKFSTKLQESFEQENWITEDSPESVRPTIIEIVEEIAALSDNLRQYCDEGSRLPNKTSNVFDKPRGNGLMTNIKKLFSERIEIYSSVKFTQRSIIFGISKIVLKTMVECTRLCTFNKNGLQQIQLDVQYLQHELGKFVSDENVIAAILEDVLISAEIRGI